MEKIDKLTYVDQAENVIKSLRVKDRNGRYVMRLTTSRIRNILSLVTGIYNRVLHETRNELSEEICEEIQYLRLRIVYEAGKDQDVKNFMNQANLLENIQDIGKNRERLLLF